MSRVSYCETTFREMWARGDSYQEIAAALGLAESMISKLKKRHGLPHRPRRQAQPTVDPTPEELEARKAEVRERHMAEKRAQPWP